ncbi:hypothetical protein KACHI17_21690 [Sediminibacterium sp. KACHI17]|uniref:Adhesin domain-containing protein n=1 Tax=Sediminibacterium sp. KACHI17 TaxID=1751071 RepID=A0AAT9GKR4_9BACT
MKRIAQQWILLSGIVTGTLNGAFAQVATSPIAQNINRSSNVNVVSVDNVAIANGFGFETRNINQEDLKSKEVSQEINMPKSGEIYIENNTRSIQVKTWDQQKVKVVTTAYFEKESTLTDEEWFEKMGISLKALGSSVKIKSGASSFGSYAYATSGQNVVVGYPTTIYNQSGSFSKSGNTNKRLLTIYVPAGSKLDIETRYSDLQLPANVGDVLLDITNGNFEAESLNKLRLRSKYANANLRDIKEAEIEFANGRFTANNIDDLDIESKYATIEMASAKKIKMVSTNDEFEVEDVTDIRGRKNYGNLRITRLAGSIEIDGSNADVKIRNVGANVKLIKINNRYADVRIPLRDMKNYSVDFIGSYSTVYGDFERTQVEPTEEEKKEYASLVQSMINTSGTLSKISSTNGMTAVNIPAQPGKATGVTNTITGGTFSGTLAPATVQGYPMYRGTNSTPTKFTANIGNGSGLKVQMKCQNCTVDFK